MYIHIFIGVSVIYVYTVFKKSSLITSTFGCTALATNQPAPPARGLALLQRGLYCHVHAQILNSVLSLRPCTPSPETAGSTRPRGTPPGLTPGALLLPAWPPPSRRCRKRTSMHGEPSGIPVAGCTRLEKHFTGWEKQSIRTAPSCETP
jgi:hypothetical protein